MLKIFYFFTAIVLFIFKPDKYTDFNADYIFILSIIYLILVLLFFLNQSIKEQNWMRFDVIFLLGYSIVHFQIPFLASIGIESSRPDFVWINKDVVNYATWMSTVSICLWMLGYLSIKPNKKLIDNNCFFIDYKLLDIVLLVVFLGFLISAGKNFLLGANDVNSWGGAATYFLLILETLLYLRIIYFFKDINKNVSVYDIFNRLILNKVFFSVLLGFTILFFLSGSRSEVISILLVTAFSYSIYIRKISLKFVVISILLGSFIFTLVGLGRERNYSDLSNQNILERGFSTLQETEKRSNFTDELAYSVRIQYRAIDTVPESHPYLFGVTYIGTLSGIVPFASSFFINTLDIPYCYQSSSRFFTCLGQGNNITYGEGSEILGDIYINFGLYGVFLVIYFFGIFSGKVQSESKSKNFNYILIYAVLITAALSINRGTILYVYKDIFYILLFHYLLSGRVKIFK